MIQVTEITSTYVESQEEFLSKLQKAVKDGIIAPLGIILDDRSTVKQRFDIIIETVKSQFKESSTTLVIPGTLIQFIFHKKELLVTILFLENRDTKEKAIRLELCKLTSDTNSVLTD